jgi:hypothetical protein
MIDKKVFDGKKVEPAPKESVNVQGYNAKQEGVSARIPHYGPAP